MAIKGEGRKIETPSNIVNAVTPLYFHALSLTQCLSFQFFFVLRITFLLKKKKNPSSSSYFIYLPFVWKILPLSPAGRISLFGLFYVQQFKWHL